MFNLKEALKMRTANLTIEVGDIVRTGGGTVGYVYRKVNDDLYAFFPSWKSTVKLHPRDKLIVAIHKHTRFSTGDTVFSSEYGLGEVINTSYTEKTVTVSFMMLGSSTESQVVYNENGTPRHEYENVTLFRYMLFEFGNCEVFSPVDSDDYDKRLTRLEEAVDSIKRYLIDD